MRRPIRSGWRALSIDSNEIRLKKPDKVRGPRFIA
jgi:hypothetical protein